MFKSHKNNIMQLTSGNTTLANERLDILSKEIAGIKESLELTQEETEEEFTKINETILTMERNLFSLKRNIEV